MKIVSYAVDHGEKHKGINPGMTEKGFADVAGLKKYLPDKPGKIWTGTGLRHFHVAKALGYNRFEADDSFGNGDSAEVIDGRPFAICENGDRVPLKEHTWLADNAHRALEAIFQLGHNDIVCCGRPFGIMLKIAGVIDFDFVDTAVYKITNEDYKISVELVYALGEIDPVLQG